MINDNENFERSINTLTKLANSLLKLPSEEIKEKLKNQPVKQFDYTRKNKLEEALEIRFNNESCTLQCEFDKEWCYKRQWFIRRWRTENRCYLKVIRLDDLVYFKCSRK